MNGIGVTDLVSLQSMAVKIPIDIAIGQRELFQDFQWIFKLPKTARLIIGPTLETWNVVS